MESDSKNPAARMLIRQTPRLSVSISLANSINRRYTWVRVRDKAVLTAKNEFFHQKTRSRQTDKYLKRRGFDEIKLLTDT